MLVNLQAGGNSCPVEPLDEPRSLSKRPRCCDRSRNSVSVESMSNYLQAGGDTCPAGPLDDADSLLNLPRRCGRRRIPDSFFLSSPNLPRCCDRQRISPPLSSSSTESEVCELPIGVAQASLAHSSLDSRIHSPCDSDCSDSDSFTPAFHSSHSFHDVRRGTQIFSACPPRSAVQVSLNPAGIFFSPLPAG